MTDKSLARHIMDAHTLRHAGLLRPARNRGTIRLALLDFAGLLMTFAAVAMVFLVGAGG